MATEIRTIRADELDAYVRLDSYAFGYEATAEVFEVYRRDYPLDWLVAAFVDGRMVAHLTHLPYRLSLNGREISLCGIADVATWPEDRRQGHVGALLRDCLVRARDAGQSLSMLYPTVPALYRHFGWATAAVQREYAVRPSDLRFVGPPAEGGRVERLTIDQWPMVAPIYDGLLAGANCALVRGEREWTRWHPERASEHLVGWRGGGGALDGYLLHRPPRQSPPFSGLMNQEFLLRELVARTPAAYRGLLGYLARHDIVRRVAWRAPVDDPLLALLADPTVVETRLRPSFMLRLVDLPAALAARGYLAGSEGALVLTVQDEAAPWNAGTWRLTVEGGQGQATASTAAPDLTLGIDTLAALYTGFLTPAAARHAGLLTARDNRALATAARLFAVARPPHCYDYF